MEGGGCAECRWASKDLALQLSYSSVSVLCCHCKVMRVWGGRGVGAGECTVHSEQAVGIREQEQEHSWGIRSYCAKQWIYICFCFFLSRNKVAVERGEERGVGKVALCRSCSLYTHLTCWSLAVNFPLLPLLPLPRWACVDCVGCRLNFAYNENFHFLSLPSPSVILVVVVVVGVKQPLANLH